MSGERLYKQWIRVLGGPETDVCYKQDTGKPRMELLLPLVKSLSEVAKVMEYGCRSMKKNLI